MVSSEFDIDRIIIVSCFQLSGFIREGGRVVMTGYRMDVQVWWVFIGQGKKGLGRENGENTWMSLVYEPLKTLFHSADFLFV